MANQYKYNYTLEEKIEEEDREALNDFYRSKTSYYNTLNDINEIILKAMKEMSNDEIKGIIPKVIRLK